MFDPSAPHIIILLIVVLLLFGSTRLPGAAKALGSSMHLFKKAVQGKDDDDSQADVTVTPVSALPAAPAQSAQDATQQQLNDLQRQLQDLKNQQAASTTGGPATPLAESQPRQQT